MGATIEACGMHAKGWGSTGGFPTRSGFIKRWAIERQRPSITDEGRGSLALDIKLGNEQSTTRVPHLTYFVPKMVLTWGTPHPTTSQPPVTSFAILSAASFASPPVDSSSTFGRLGTSRARASARSTTGGLSIEEKR